MASNQTNRLQSLDSSVEGFVDGHENENAKQKTKHDVALFHEFLVLKGEMRQTMDKLTPQKMKKEYERVLVFYKEATSVQLSNCEVTSPPRVVFL